MSVTEPNVRAVQAKVYDIPDTDKLVGLTIRGRSSGVTAKVLKIFSEQQSERNSLTLYVSYIETSIDSSQIDFFDNEILEATTPIEISNNIFIAVGEGFANTKIINAVSRSSAFTIEEGIYENTFWG